MVRRQRVREEKICIKNQQITSWRQQPTFNKALLFSITVINILTFFPLTLFVVKSTRHTMSQCKEILFSSKAKKHKTLLFIYVRLNIILLNHVGGKHTKLFKASKAYTTMHKAANFFFIARRLLNGTKAIFEFIQMCNLQHRFSSFVGSALRCYLIHSSSPPSLPLLLMPSHSLTHSSLMIIEHVNDLCNCYWRETINIKNCKTSNYAKGLQPFEQTHLYLI